MERLTKRDTDGQAMMDCEKCKADWTGKHGKPMVDCTALYCRNRLKDRLAVYEDSACAPEEVLPEDKADEIALKLMRLADLASICSYTRLRELAEADKDGRLVVHARWVSVAGKRDRICSRCLRNEPYKNADDDAEVFEFCPHCGAKMDGGDGDAVNQR